MPGYAITSVAGAMATELMLAMGTPPPEPLYGASGAIPLKEIMALRDRMRMMSSPLEDAFSILSPLFAVARPCLDAGEAETLERSIVFAGPSKLPPLPLAQLPFGLAMFEGSPDDFAAELVKRGVPTDGKAIVQGRECWSLGRLVGAAYANCVVLGTARAVSDFLEQCDKVTQGEEPGWSVRR